MKVGLPPNMHCGICPHPLVYPYGVYLGGGGWVGAHVSVGVRVGGQLVHYIWFHMVGEPMRGNWH